MDEHDTERMVLFSDAVIAITITLLVLELRLPGPAAEMSDAQLWAGIVETLPNLFAYMLSFVVIGTFWIGHRRAFSHIKRSDSVLIWLNMFFLMALGLTPFVTGILAENGGSVGTSLYAGLIAIASLLLGSMTPYARHAGLAEPAAKHRAIWAGYSNAIVFGLSIPLAFYNAELAKYFWLLLLPLGALSGRYRRAR
ncbi:MAG: hypothetical protein JWP26_3692 [Devosia sp.]|uniref:TMEM175 family protein n=1 Tax=Devosia sp. TaxID=1871048 RepID=UPI00260274CD|nr:TMEM175 family protein [Devosia sp.]MDB5536780.1 hypothetical protein [Devosia sp.]MDB5588722.1 hypothetical protein [Devosia sp.]